MAKNLDPTKVFDVTKHISLVPPFQEKEVDKYFLHFEKVAENRALIMTLSGGAMVLDKLPVPGRPTIWITAGQGPTALAVGAGWGLFGHFYSHLSFLSSFSLSFGDGPI